MPRGNRTGPMGAGPMTGRGAGYCAGYDAPGFANPGGWASRGRAPGGAWGSRGAGRGRRNMYYATGMPGWARAGYVPPAPTEEDEVVALRTQADYLNTQLEAVTKRIEELEQG